MARPSRAVAGRSASGARRDAPALGWGGPERAPARGAAFPCPEALGLLQPSRPSASAGPTRATAARAYAPEWSTTRPAACRPAGGPASGPRGGRQAASPCETTRRCPWRLLRPGGLRHPTAPRATWSRAEAPPPPPPPAAAGASLGAGGDLGAPGPAGAGDQRGRRQDAAA